jgi:Flp pilus assembly protein TadG
MRIHSQRRSGKIAVLVALSLVGIVGVTAIAVDGGLLMDERERAQAAADAAAMAAATDLFTNYRLNGGVDKNGTANASALANAAADGYANDGTTSTVTVNIPPTSGPYTNQLGCAEVIVQYNQKRAFSNIFGDGDIPVKARAVARVKWVPSNIGVLVLDASGKNALNMTASGNVSLTGLPASVIVNSSDPSGAVMSGSGNLTANEFDMHGNPGWLTTGTGRFIGTLDSGMAIIPDPLQNLTPPDPGTLPMAHSGGTLSITDVDLGSNTTVLSPGVYQQGISISAVSNGTVTMKPGIYYMQGGGFQLSGSANLVGNGVMIYNAPTTSNDVVSITGTGNVTLSPLTSGMYSNFTIWQDRSSNAPVTLTGNGNMNLTGSIYAASAPLNITSNGGSNSIGSQYVSSDLTLSGNNNTAINFTGGAVPAVRLIGLVE